MKRFRQYTEDVTPRTITGPVRSEQSRQNDMNRYLSQVGRQYYVSIPLNDIFDRLRTNGWMAVQEDGTAWSGLFAGRDGRAVLDLVDINTSKPSRRTLSVQWHKMDSGTYEVTAYVS